MNGYAHTEKPEVERRSGSSGYVDLEMGKWGMWIWFWRNVNLELESWGKCDFGNGEMEQTGSGEWGCRERNGLPNHNTNFFPLNYATFASCLPPHASGNPPHNPDLEA